MGSPGSKVEKLSIGSLDNISLTVAADYNPKELQIAKQIPWKQNNGFPGANPPTLGRMAPRWLGSTTSSRR